MVHIRSLRSLLFNVALAGAALGSMGAIASTTGCASPSEDDDGDAQESVDALTARPWNAAAEQEFSAWVAGIGTARASGRCRTLNACMNDGTINTLRAAGDPNLDLFADCADVPMHLRAYFALKTNRPFKYVSDIAGNGGDERYSAGNHPVAYRTASASAPLQRTLRTISDGVHSGFYRMAPEVQDNDTYTIKPSPTSIRPGTVYYDPNGHVLIVYRVDADGTIWTMDGHPDNSLTFGPLTEGKYAVGGRAQGGGFRNFRPERVVDGTIGYVPNSELPEWGDNQYGHGDTYVAWIRSQISTGPGPTPEQQLGLQLDQLCVDLGDRVRSSPRQAGSFLNRRRRCRRTSTAPKATGRRSPRRAVTPASARASAASTTS